MSWFKVDDKLHSHTKAAKAGTDALGLWVLCGSWCADQLSNGFVPNYIARRLDPKWLSGSRKLVAAGLWVVGVNDGDEGWWFHDWSEYQPTREDVEQRRASSRERMRKLRGSSREHHANERRSSEMVRDTRPDPAQPKNKDTAADAAEFASWWAAYPRKVGKGTAQAKYRAARKKADASALLAAAVEFAAANIYTDPKFIPHPATWLNGERWLDVPDARPVSRGNLTEWEADFIPTPQRVVGGTEWEQ